MAALRGMQSSRFALSLPQRLASCSDDCSDSLRGTNSQHAWLREQDRVELEREARAAGSGSSARFERESPGVQDLQKHRLTSFSGSELVAAVDALGRRRHGDGPLRRDLLPRELHQQVVPVLVGGLESSRHALGSERHIRTCQSSAALR